MCASVRAGLWGADSDVGMTGWWGDCCCSSEVWLSSIAVHGCRLLSRCVGIATWELGVEVVLGFQTVFKVMDLD